MTDPPSAAFAVLGAFVAGWPLLMMFVWTIGGVAFYAMHERGRRDHHALPDLSGAPRVSVLIPCFNEADNIEETVRSCAAQVYPALEIVAVNDGSGDGTAAVLDRLLGAVPNLRVVHLARNQGKAIALRSAAMAAAGEVLVCIDGDAILHPHCVAWLAQQFARSPRLGAVTGNPRIRNRSSLLGRLQVGEFSATVGLIKRTQRIDGRLFTVSGVVTAFRRAALHDVGYWSPDNLTEDVDVTWKLERRRWAVHFEPNALAYILMPETLRGLWRQRLRWAEGGAQTFLRYAPGMLTWPGRRMWGVLGEYATTLVWCYAMLLTLALTLGRAAGLVPASWGPTPALLSVWGMLLSVACLFQFAVSTWLDRRIERDEEGAFSPFASIIWYPAAFWLLSATAAAVGFPRALLRRRGLRARWVSPDRGFR